MTEITTKICTEKITSAKLDSPLDDYGARVIHENDDGDVRSNVVIFVYGRDIELPLYVWDKLVELVDELRKS